MRWIRFLPQVAVYTRTSTKTNAAKSGAKRQRDNIDGLASLQSAKVVKSLTEVVSGSLPLDKRKTFSKFLQDCGSAGINKVYVESSRAVARDATVAEAFFTLSKKIGVTIVPSDVPTLYQHNPNPVEKFLRRVMMSFTELEKDLTVQRLQSGLKAKMDAAKKAAKSSKKPLLKGKPVLRAQTGKTKVNGRLSILQKLQAAGKLTSVKKAALKRAATRFSSGGTLKGKGGLQARLKHILQLKVLGHETARRMAAEITNF